MENKLVTTMGSFCKSASNLRDVRVVVPFKTLQQFHSH